MATKKPRILIIGAGMAGLTAAHKLHTSSSSKDLFEICVVEAGNRLGGRIFTSEFCGDRVELGATWIHGIKGSPVHEIAQKLNSLESTRPWECKDAAFGEPITIAEGGYEISPDLVDSVSNCFDKFMGFAQGKVVDDGSKELSEKAYEKCVHYGIVNIGSFLDKGFEAYWDLVGDKEEVKGCGDWDKKTIYESVFKMKENTQRTYTSADDLLTLDYEAESEYQMFSGEEITIAKGYMSIIESLASVLPSGSVQFGKKVTKIEWRNEDHGGLEKSIEGVSRVVKVHFSDGSIMFADHVIVTVSLGVLKAGVSEKSCESSPMFDPPLPSFKIDAISRLGYGVVDKLFLELSPSNGLENENGNKYPFLQMAFHPPGSEFRDPKVPWWMRKTNSLCPIYGSSNVVLSWFAGKEAFELESLEDEEIVEGVSKTLSCFLPKSNSFKISKILKTRWGNDPLFLGSYSYVAIGSSGDDLDTMAVPLPENGKNGTCSSFPLQILFAGEATHRTHYSTTHGAYFSGLREANRLLQHYGI